MVFYDKFGKEAYKIALDLEGALTQFQTELNETKQGLISVNQLIQDLDLTDFEHLQQQIDALSTTISGVLSQQQQMASQISTLQSKTAEIELDISAVQTILSNKADKSELANYVPTSRKVNNKQLQADIQLNHSDIGLSELSQADVDNYFD